MAETLNPFEIAQQQLDAAAKLLKLDPATHEVRRNGERNDSIEAELLHVLEKVLDEL